MVTDRDGSGWKGTFFDDDGRPLTDCALVMRSLVCAAKKDDHLFLNFAGRFSMKAAMPSF